MLRSEVDLAGLLSLYVQVRRGKRVTDDETNPLVSVLRLSGITRVEDGRLQVRNRIYERVFDREWVTGEYAGRRAAAAAGSLPSRSAAGHCRGLPDHYSSFRL